ncbi:hypothetical protein PACTADRAFT_49235 [Pachysolen tannophilus NRRL Y-2460]|uniref:Crossover junction endonuclease MUS81 n=1 Tax=Pachysolen tannophilus NRRL Y-2460 TaxID=669874 RepID=A0A1E4TVJ0_PACTA|nr:hypothetical protein PACTADRAFT_49235 [Pachysolen tannophilus NRRL Y-2460]
MELPQDLKHLFAGWLEQEASHAAKHGNKSVMLYNKALDRLRKCPMIIKEPRQLLSIQFIGPKIVSKLSSKLVDYCEDNGFKVPEYLLERDNQEGKRKNNENDKNDDGGNGESVEPPAKKRRKTVRRYVPARRSGGYAILLVLLIHDPEREGMTKDDIIRYATPYCDTSFHSNPSTNQFYSAWISHKTLINRNLVESSGRPLQFFLTDEGVELATLLRQTHDQDNIINKDNQVINEKNSWNSNSPNLLEQELIVDDSNEETISNEQILNKLIFHKNQYCIWEAGTYSILLVIDNREIRSQSQRDYFTKKFFELGIDSKTLPLTVGDGIWIARNEKTNTEVVLNFIFERKRLDDLASSIKDGRYAEQKSRLRKTGLKNVFYIVEEQMASDVSMMGDAIQTSISMTITTSNFFIKRTKDSDDTIKFLSLLTEKIKNFYSNKKLIVIEKPHDIKTQLEYSQILQKFQAQFDTDLQESVHKLSNFQSILSKSDMITVKELFIKMLMTIKGMSLDKALKIQTHFKTPKNLIQNYRNCENISDKEKLLSDLFCNEITNKKIGPSLSKKVYEIWGGTSIKESSI